MCINYCNYYFFFEINCLLRENSTSDPDYTDIAISTLVFEVLKVPTPSSPRYLHTDDHPSQPLHTRRAPSTLGKLSSYFEIVLARRAMHIKNGVVSI